MTLFEYSVKVASLLGGRDSRQYAFLLTPKGKVVCAGAHTGEARDTYQTALINALQNNFKDVSENAWAVCTYAPTQMCQGMAHMLGVHGIRYSSSGDDKILKMKKESWDEATFRTQVSSFSSSCDTGVANFKWEASVAKALDQAKDTKNFKQNAVSLFQSMDLATKTANVTRAKESDNIAAALNQLPKGPPPGGGTFDKADEAYTHLVFGMVGQTWNPTMQFVKRKELTSGEQAIGNNIAGILLDADFQIVAWALNFAAENPTFHAETLMVQRFLRIKGLQKLPPNYTVYTSLQPCDMCGSFLLHVGDKTKVVYCLKDVNLSTVLTQTKTPTAASERQVTISGNGLVRAAKTMGETLATKNKTAQTNTAMLLADAQDGQYRGLSLEAQGKTSGQLSPQTRAGLTQNSPFSYPPKSGVGTLDLQKKQRLGFEFVRSADQIIQWAASREKNFDQKLKKAAAQGVEVFEALVTGGFTTAYGLKMINIVIKKQGEAAAKATAATNT